MGSSLELYNCIVKEETFQQREVDPLEKTSQKIMPSPIKDCSSTLDSTPQRELITQKSVEMEQEGDSYSAQIRFDGGSFFNTSPIGVKADL